jgi:hypothetical protein
VRETWPAADHNRNPARRWESLTCIRSIEGTASSPGPMDHNCNPARCVCWCVKPGPQRITTATRPGVRRSMNPPTGATPSSTGPQGITTATRLGVCCSMIHPTGATPLSTGPQGIATATRLGLCCSIDSPTGATPSSTGPQRITTATRPGVGNRLPAFDPSRELQRVPAPWITTATRPGVCCSMFCDCKYNPTRGGALLCLWFYSVSSPHFVRAVADVLRTL